MKWAPSYLTTPEEGLKGERIYLDVVSIGATINTILAAVKAKGKTIIENVAKEPESSMSVSY